MRKGEALQPAVPTPDVAANGPMLTPAQLQRLSTQVGNRQIATSMQHGPMAGPAEVQRIPITVTNTSETLYENPNMSPGGVPIAAPTAAQKQFTATQYGGAPAKYDMDRSTSGITVTVNILFVDQKRGENQFLKDAKGNFVVDAKGNKQADPTYRQDVGEQAEIKDAERIGFATKHCGGITKSWDHYDFVSKETKAHGGFLGFFQTAPKKEEVRLPVKFVAKPVFDLGASNVHTTIRLFGMGTVAKRSGAHPIDSGHWYMDTKTNYGSMDLDAVTAHEYGHLVGLPDEYSQSNDFMHQMLHRMGGGAKNADKELDQFATRQMVGAAMAGPILNHLNTNVAAVAQKVEQAKDMIGKQLGAAVRKSWMDPGIRSMMTTEVTSALKAAQPKGSASKFDANTVGRAVAFETGPNLSNLTIAKGAIPGFTAQAIIDALWGEYTKWVDGLTSGVFSTKGADGSEVKIRTAFSGNVTGAATGAGPVAGAASSFVNSAIGASNVPAVGPSPSLFNAIEDLPNQWKAPGKGIGGVHDAAFLKSHVRATLDTAAKSWPAVKNAHDLYNKLLAIVTSTAETSAKASIGKLIDTSVVGTLKGQLASLKTQIETEVDAAMGMKADGLAVKSADPNLKKVAEHLYGLLKAQQNSKLWDQKADVDPGSGSAGMDVRYSSNSVMSSNDTSKAGQRADMINPVLAQFNAHLKKSYEDTFKAQVKR